MRTITLALTAALLVTVLAVVASAQDRRSGATSGPRAEPGTGERFVERLVKELNLTQDQQTQVRQIFQTQRQAVENWRKENQAKVEDLSSQIKEALKAGDKDKAKAARQELQKIH